jgi:hypothetical protein
VLTQATQPIVVKVIEPAADSTTIADVLIGALGLTGALLLVAALCGAALGGILIAVKLLRARYDLEPTPDSEALRIT